MYFVTCGIPGAFVKSYMDGTMHAQLTGPLAMILDQVDQNKYKKYIINEKDIPVTYMIMKKVLYGTQQVDLLF